MTQNYMKKKHSSYLYYFNYFQRYKDVNISILFLYKKLTGFIKDYSISKHLNYSNYSTTLYINHKTVLIRAIFV